MKPDPLEERLAELEALKRKLAKLHRDSVIITERTNAAIRKGQEIRAIYEHGNQREQSVDKRLQ